MQTFEGKGECAMEGSPNLLISKHPRFALKDDLSVKKIREQPVTCFDFRWYPQQAAFLAMRQARKRFTCTRWRTFRGRHRCRAYCQRLITMVCQRPPKQTLSWYFWEISDWFSGSPVVGFHLVRWPKVMSRLQRVPPSGGHSFAPSLRVSGGISRATG